MTNRNSMFEMLKSLIPPSIRPQAESQQAPARTSVLGEKVRADIDRIVAAHSLDLSGAASIEEGIRNKFRRKIANILGLDIEKAISSDYSTLEAACMRPSLPPEKGSSDRRQVIRMMALTEGLDRGFTSIKALELAVVRKRVRTIAQQEGLDPELAFKEGLYRAIMLKHMEERDNKKRKPKPRNSKRPST